MFAKILQYTVATRSLHRTALSTLSGNLRTKQNCYVLSIATGNPEHILYQEDALALAKEYQTATNLEAIYQASHVKKRHMVHIPAKTGTKTERHGIQIPTEERERMWWSAARPLAKSVVQEALDKAGVSTKQVGNLIVVTSTSLCRIPGLEVALIRDMGINRQAKRSFVGSMGCSGTMTSMEIARNWVMQQSKDSHQVAVVVAIDLYSIYIARNDTQLHTLYNSMLADGCGATILGGNGCIQNRQKGVVKLVDTAFEFFPGTEDLSKSVPAWIQKVVHGYAERFLEGHGLTVEAINNWCLHPGAAAVLTAFGKGLNIEKQKSVVVDVRTVWLHAGTGYHVRTEGHYGRC